MTAASLGAAPAEPDATQPLGHPHPGLRVALAQLPIEDGNQDQNMRLAEEAARQATEQKADFLNLPEAADWGWLYQQARRDALPIPGKYTDFLAALAKRHKMWVSAGCLEKDGDKVYNSAVIIDRTGRIVLKHRKIDTLPELTKDLYDRGNPEDIKTVDTEFGRIGLTICADNFNLKNPQRVADQGAWLLIAPHGFAAEESKLEQNSREYQNHIRKVAGATRLWVVATDAVLGTIQGGAWKGQLHSGCSLVARPDGTAAIVAKFKQPDLIVFDIPAGQVSKPTFGKGRVKIGGVQLAGMRGDKTNNIVKAERMIRAAAAQGAQVIMTPEVALTGFVGGEQERAMAEPIPGPTSERFGQLAKELGVYLVVGMSELRADPAGKPSQTELCNAMPVFSPRGDLMGVMRKVHINRYEIGGGWRNGSDFPVWDFRTPTGQFRGGIMVCYDRELPESARILMLKGADVIFNPLACGCPTSDIHRCLLRTRAFENELFVFMVNHAAPRENGHSMVFDFEGNIVKEMDDREGVFVYDLDLDALNKHREKGIYAFHHRRPELYGILSDPAGQVHPPEVNLPPTQ